MRDGVKLATDVYLPEGEGPFPVILSRTPYGRRLGVGTSVEMFLKADYAVVLQDMRGRFGSEGKAFVFSTDREDGHDTISWIARQPWSDGRVGTYGASALGITQYALAPGAPDALKCMYVVVATANPAEDGFYQGGVFRLGLVAGWLVRTGLPRDHLKFVYSSSDEAKQLIRKLVFDQDVQKVHVPVMHVGGWFDIFTEGILNAFRKFQLEGGKGARGKQKLIIGPWNHGVGGRRAGDLVFPENAKYTFDPVEWFDRCIKNERGGVDPIPPVRYYQMGDVQNPSAPGNVWKKDIRWPVKTVEQAWYFHQNGELTLHKPRKQASLAYLYDPEDYVPTICGAELTLRLSPCDQREVENRDDVLLFTSEPLKEPLAITGKLQVIAYISSQAKDTDFTAKLTDVYPDGRSILIVDGIQRARFREGLEKEVLLTPGKVTKIKIVLGSTSLVFNRGHRIRIAISSSNFPRFLVNPNTGKSLAFTQQAIHHIYRFGLSQQYEPALIYSELRPVINTLYVSKKYPSRVLLPVSH